jgi:hypothetical protein
MWLAGKPVFQQFWYCDTYVLHKPNFEDCSQSPASSVNAQSAVVSIYIYIWDRICRRLFDSVFQAVEASVVLAVRWSRS